MYVKGQECRAYLCLGENKVDEDQFEANPNRVEQGEVLVPWLAVVDET